MAGGASSKWEPDIVGCKTPPKGGRIGITKKATKILSFCYKSVSGQERAEFFGVVFHNIYTPFTHTSDTCIQCLQGVQVVCKEYVSALRNCSESAR